MSKADLLPGSVESRVLLIDDDSPFLQAMSRSLTARGLSVKTACDAEAAMRIAEAWSPSHAVLDMNLQQETSGLDLIRPMLALCPDLRIVVLTGYASLATAVNAVKTGAADYLAKPVDGPTLLACLGLADSLSKDQQSDDDFADRMSLKRLEWEHINRVLAEHDGNVSAAARALGLYRRTLQRKLEKRPVRD